MRTLLMFAVIAFTTRIVFAGAEGGPQAGRLGTFNIKFKGGETAVIAATSTQGMAEITVFDSEGNQVAYDMGKPEAGVLAMVWFTPKDTATYKVKVNGDGSPKWRSN